jgi:hypothetical protein
VYSDGRKREVVLQEVARRMDLSAFEFRIFGNGWEAVIEKLRAAGAVVQYAGETDDYRKDYEALQLAIPHFDYYLYLGIDEGSLGTLDALNAGVPTIITPQGFHLDLPGGITHAVVSADDLQRIFDEIAAQRNERRLAVAGLTWAAYAERHLELWRATLQQIPLPALPVVNESLGSIDTAFDVARRRSRYVNALHPLRVLSAISRMPALAKLRRAVNRVRLSSR